MPDLRQDIQAPVPSVIQATVNGRNRIWNSDFYVNQIKQGSVSVSGTQSDFVCDMWKVLTGITSGAVQGSIVDNGVSSTAPRRSIRASVTTALAPTAAGSCPIYTVIEADDLSDLGLGSVGQRPFYISFKARANKSGQYSVNLIGDGAGPNSLYQMPFTLVANTWADVVLGPISNITSQNWTAGAGSGGLIYMSVALATGATVTGGVANTPQLASFRKLSADVQLNQAGDFFEMGEPFLYQSDLPAPQRWAKPVLTETWLQAKRFYQKSYPHSSPPGSTLVSGQKIQSRNQGAATDYHDSVTFGTAFRRSPLVTVYSPVTGTAGVARDYFSNTDVTFTVQESSESSFRAFVSSGFSPNPGAVGYHWVAEAQW